jgi:hypothetical protein
MRFTSSGKYTTANLPDWIEAQKQRLLQNSEVNGEFGCLLCKLGGGQTAYSTLTVTFPLLPNS